jgi:hypothetical protein
MKKVVDDVTTVKKEAYESAVVKKVADDFLTPGSLGTSRKPSFVISCTTSMILIWFYWCIACHPLAGHPLLGGPALRVNPKPTDPRTPLKLTVPRDQLLGLLVAMGSRSPVQPLQRALRF